MAGTKKGTPRKDKRRDVVGLRSAGAGRKPWKPSEADKQLIRSLAGRGLSDDHIAVHLKVSKPTLLKHAAELIEEGKAQGIAGVTGVLYQQAMKGSFKHAAYYLGNVAGWATNRRVQVESSSLEALILESMGKGGDAG